MKKLIETIEKLKKSNVKNLIDQRMKEFSRIGNSNNMDIFKEMCFCFLTANFNAERSINIQKKMGDNFLLLSESQLAEKLREFGHRYPNSRAKYIVEARKYKDSLKEIIFSFNSEEASREWLIKNIKGLGYKEASHFLRNIGFKNLAIIDFHIIDLLNKHGLIEKPKYISKNVYLEIENLLRSIARKTKLSLAELDLYLWYIETRKVLK
jgi:N-glycosylase/DNA lyase